MPKYSIKLNDCEIKMCNLCISNDNVRASAMSVLAYLLKENIKQNEIYAKTKCDLLKKDKYKLKISNRKFLDKYNNRGINNKKISLTTLKNRIHLLIDIGLISVEKVGKTFLYSFKRYFNVTNNMSNKLTNLKVNEPIENTSVELNSQNDKDLNNKVLDIDTINRSEENLFENSFISENLEKCQGWDDIKELLFAAFKFCKVKSNIVKGEVIDKIERNLTNISKKFAKNYIIKTILQVQYKNKINKVHYENAIKSDYANRKKDNWNYDGQRDYRYYSNLEQQLLGLA